jgi:hypothetical protein
VQLKATLYQTASVSKQDSLTYKQESCEHAEAVHEIKVASGEAKCGQPSSHVRLPMEQDKKTKVVLQTVETAVVKIKRKMMALQFLIAKELLRILQLLREV